MSEAHWKLTSIPVIQGPMAGGYTTAELVSAVSNIGGLGSIGAGYMSPDSLRSLIKKVKSLTANPFAVNLFIPTSPVMDQAQLERMKKHLLPYYRLVGMDSVPELSYDPDLFQKQFSVVLEEKVPAFSFTFGCLKPAEMAALKAQNVFVMGTATSMEEALYLQEQGCDAIVAQGLEAGGHRGSFLEGKFPLLPAKQLVLEMAPKLNIPVIAAGGIVTRADMHTMLSSGANAVQIGTAFLVCQESGASREYRELLLKGKPEDTELIKVFSGRWARGLSNRFSSEMKVHEADTPDYPIQHWLTAALRKKAQESGHTELQSLWAGQGLGALRACAVAEYMATLTR
ncbi:NAD(P)H-dependent flavin oxidoreductase [Bdellovibrio bacteriovorus]|uniref:Nitronate monooxygenase n=1 Tax=Bdellovibrio bacteriovorus str. Tiberius TaxID=1069642 RepID=K7ZE90_BDEBC|nr:nitronate monooxygenase [Bdellovibrio bacteriovorus]AFY00257.1 2-nitropropane dioxygenase [Bdellovibrio bacteriovorus str. Tiberius]